MVQSGAFDIKRNIIRNPGNGLPKDYKSGYLLKPKYAPGELAIYLHFGYADFFRTSYPVFKEIRSSNNLPDLKFQVGVPSGFDVALGSLGTMDAIRYRKDFNL